jgi:hypothetical protein
VCRVPQGRTDRDGCRERRISSPSHVWMRHAI